MSFCTNFLKRSLRNTAWNARTQNTDTHTFAPLRCRAEHVVALCCGVRRRRGPAL